MLCSPFSGNGGANDKKAFPPQNWGRKANLPRYHPQFAKRRAYEKLPFFATDNEVTRRALLLFQAAAPGRKPGNARKRFPPSRSLCKRKPLQDDPFSAILNIAVIITRSSESCKYFLWEKEFFCRAVHTIPIFPLGRRFQALTKAFLPYFP